MAPALERHRKLFLNFPSPPAVALRLIELNQNPNTTIRQAAQAFALDPALASKLLRVANSALYTHLHRSDSISQALVVLGLNSALTLGLSFSLLNSLKGAGSLGVDYTLFWRRSLIASVAAKSVGEAVKNSQVEELFLAGLIQDIGILALSRAQPGLYQMQPAGHQELAGFERRHYGEDHAAVGGWLLQSWKLPQHIVEAVAASHGTRARGQNEAQGPFNVIIQLSGSIADLFLNPEDEMAASRVAQEAQLLLGLDSETFTAVLARIADVLPDTATLFEMDLPHDASRIIDNARSLMAARHLSSAVALANP